MTVVRIDCRTEVLRNRVLNEAREKFAIYSTTTNTVSAFSERFCCGID